MKTGKHMLRGVLCIVIILAAAFLIYTMVYYRADETAKAAMQSDASVSVSKTSYGWFFDGPSETDVLIFYPGGKVEAEAYAPFLHLLAEKGTDVCLARMPLRLAVFGMNKASGIMKMYEYENWFIGGHSLGGAIAATYAAEHGAELKGLVLCAAYPTKQLPKDLLEITVYGTEDRILNLQKAEAGKEFSPRTSVELVIDGGNHAQFGNYGIQRGDGTALITAEEQQEEAAEYIVYNMHRIKEQAASK